MADGDNWIFDSLVNFLHGNIWRIPVLGFVEENSVVFDPDGYNTMSEEREKEFRKIHEEYRTLVDYMLSSFMDDLQVTPEQVEEACQLREIQSSIPESHVTKMALEQLQAAEDFNVFRRIMTRKNIDLQLQSLELLVAKYGVLAPALRSIDAPESKGDGKDVAEDDFLQVVMRYCGEFCGFFEKVSDAGAQSSTISSACRNVNRSTNLHYATEYDTIANLKKLVALSMDHENPSTSTSTKSTIADTLCNQKLQSWPPLQNPYQENQLPVNEESGLTAHNFFLQQLQQRFQKYEILVHSQLMQHDLEEDVNDHGKDVVAVNESNATPTKVENQESRGKKKDKKAVKFDETTVADIATVAPEQHRILSSVRKALDMEPDDDASEYDPTTMSLHNTVDMTCSEEDIEKRRAYLRAQRDKLVAMKKREREKQLKAEGKDSDGNPLRPKSARAAQIALTSPPAGGTTKSLAARRALAARLKKELFNQ